MTDGIIEDREKFEILEMPKVVEEMLDDITKEDKIMTFRGFKNFWNVKLFYENGEMQFSQDRTTKIWKVTFDGKEFTEYTKDEFYNKFILPSVMFFGKEYEWVRCSLTMLEKFQRLCKENLDVYMKVKAKRNYFFKSSDNKVEIPGYFTLKEWNAYKKQQQDDEVDKMLDGIK